MKTAFAATVPFVAFLLLVPSAPVLALRHGLQIFASLPADTFAPGPTSGQLIAPANGRIPPFDGKQPVQGFSSVLRPRRRFPGDVRQRFRRQGELARLRAARLPDRPGLPHRNGGAGTIDVQSFITLSDPYRRINFPIVADRRPIRERHVPDNTIPVDRRDPAPAAADRWRLRHRVVPRGA